MRRAWVRMRESNWCRGLACIVITCSLPSRIAVAQADPQIPTGMQRFAPEHATITQQMSVDFGNGVEPGAVAVLFTLPPVYADSYDIGLRILRRKGASEWTVAYEETDEIDPGADGWTLQKVKAASGQEGLVVVYYHSGAGTTTNWKLIAAGRGKFVALDPKPIRDKVLTERHSVFGGYNGVKADGDMVTEEIAGYSENQARCCPDKPRIAMRVRFTGTAIKLAGVSELPGAGAR